jgi:hypothetical protein
MTSSGIAARLRDPLGIGEHRDQGGLSIQAGYVMGKSKYVSG